jgi:hypothetical protein
MLRNSIFLVTVLCFCMFVFLSCSDNEPEIISATGSVIFDFASESDLPSVRLSVFSSMASDVHRVKEIHITCLEDGYVWNIMSPQMISSDGKQWAGYTRLEPRSGDILVCGTYHLTYIDDADLKTETTFSVSYPPELIKVTASSVRTFLKGALADSVALYSQSGALLYFDKKKLSWNNAHDIIHDYSDAVMMRNCISTGDFSVICMLPPVMLRSDVLNED